MGAECCDRFQTFVQSAFQKRTTNKLAETVLRRMHDIVQVTFIEITRTVIK